MSEIHPHLLVIDDDAVFNRVLSRALTQRGFSVYSAHSQAEALQLADTHEPEFVVLDLNLDGESGLKLIAPLLGINPNARILVLTGYASIATAVNAVKLGAVQYLAKPADVDAIVNALQADELVLEDEIDSRPLSVDQVEWEHIQRVLTEHAGNISATARALNMHRRTLQRKLARPPARP
ncbi:response regulator transcription factor [Thauera sp. CAU 1555]|uniref:Response regulator transcription factor n=1 Tax=Thauera sedimentorum TaxID=2767595 RepID=A0ABR9BBJ6_9RHOO|nr:response regulator transcription factor [Thauera sedimentorum]MBC9071903.1 response regulator transcription factor [Thauera sedimentorum]MBD8502822.1 response regulator transcription factor [Thauera sedimentorum]